MRRRSRLPPPARRRSPAATRAASRRARPRLCSRPRSTCSRAPSRSPAVASPNGIYPQTQQSPPRRRACSRARLRAYLRHRDRQSSALEAQYATRQRALRSRAGRVRGRSNSASCQVPHSLGDPEAVTRPSRFRDFQSAALRHRSAAASRTPRISWCRCRSLLSLAAGALASRLDFFFPCSRSGCTLWLWLPLPRLSIPGSGLRPLEPRAFELVRGGRVVANR
jgi:hypothetical protein